MGDKDEKLENGEPDESLDDDDAEGEGDEESETELDTESDDDEDLEDEDEEADNAIPQDRFDKVYAQAKSAERKLDEFKRLGPEAYYKLYPDEAPEDSGGDTDDETALAESEEVDVNSLVVQSGVHEGKTLAQVYQDDPAAAVQMHNEYLADQREAAANAKAQIARDQEEVTTEALEFLGARAQEAFEKPLEQCSQEEQQQLLELSEKVTEWMLETGRGSGRLQDAFILMNTEKLFDSAKNQGVKSILKALNTGTVPNVSSSKTTGSAKGYGRYMGMSPEALADEFDNMPDKEQERFLKKAPKAFREKFPGLPYD
jgi:hypothetical protein